MTEGSRQQAAGGGVAAGQPWQRGALRGAAGCSAASPHGCRQACCSGARDRRQQAAGDSSRAAAAAEWHLSTQQTAAAGGSSEPLGADKSFCRVRVWRQQSKHTTAALTPAWSLLLLSYPPGRREQEGIRAERGGSPIPSPLATAAIASPLPLPLTLAPLLLFHPQGVENKKTYELSEEEISKLRSEVDKYTTESDLRRTVAQNIKRLKDIGSYRGRRHIAVSAP